MLLIVRGEIGPGSEAACAGALKSVVSFACLIPGLVELHLLHRSGRAPAFMLLGRFENRKARHAFVASANYRRWLRSVTGCARPAGDRA